jgi:Fe-S cluster assembly scaffold protein SufB
MSERELALDAFAAGGWDRKILEEGAIAHLVASGNSIVSGREAEGLSMDAAETSSGIRVAMRVREGAVLPNPVHLCFGIRHEEGTQEIEMEIALGRNASARFVAHCLFPKAQKVRHAMNGSVDVGEGARMRYSETHYHGWSGGVEVIPKMRVTVRKGGEYSSEFVLVRGRVGRLATDIAVEALDGAVAELVTRVFGHGNDSVTVREEVVLSGRDSRGLIKTRVALEDEASAEVTGITEGNAPGARGHVDCVEIVKDRAVARALPVVATHDPLAKVTHEAAIGTVDRKALETLMARGLSPEEAVAVIITGILR